MAQDKHFAFVKKSVPSLIKLFQTNNAPATITTLTQLETYHMDI